VTLEVCGEVDMSNARELETALAKASETSPAQLVVDLAGLEFIDSTGLRALVTFHRRDRAETDIAYRNACGQVAEVLEITGLGSVLELEDG
jgi:anti-sigma B factor antagonist